MQTTKGTIANKPVLYAFMFCNSPSTKTQYPRRLKLFFDFIGLEGEDLKEQGEAFLDDAKQEGARKSGRGRTIQYVRRYDL